MRSPLAPLALPCACVALALASCRTPLEINGRVSPRATVTLPAGAVLEVQIADVTRPDQAPVVVLKRRYGPLGAAPWRFTLRPENPRAFDPMRAYAVQVRVVVNGKPHLVNKRRTYLHPERLADTLDIVVEPVPRTVGARIGDPAGGARARARGLAPSAARKGPKSWNPPGRPATLPAPIPTRIASLAPGSAPRPADEPFSTTMRPECPPSSAP